MPMSTDEVMAKWRQLSDRVDVVTRECMASPDAAAVHGITPEIEKRELFAGVGGNRGPQPVNLRAAWMRSVAKTLIPQGWRWEVAEMIGGGASLMLQGYDPNPNG